MARSLGFGSTACNWTPISDSLSLRLRDLVPLTLLHTSNSPDHYAKGTPSAAPNRSSRLSLRPLVGAWFQVLFHSAPAVLFTFPSRYWFAIGHERVFSLREWSPRILAGFHVSRDTWDPCRSRHAFVYRTITFCGEPSQGSSTSMAVCNSANSLALSSAGPATPSIQRTPA